jgi:hypothetical protein
MLMAVMVSGASEEKGIGGAGGLKFDTARRGNGHKWKEWQIDVECCGSGNGAFH